MDAPELLRILDCRGGAPDVLRGRRISATETLYPTPAHEFELARVEVIPGQPCPRGNRHGPECLLVLEGEARLRLRAEALALRRGEVALVPAHQPYAVETTERRSVLYRAGVPVPP